MPPRYTSSHVRSVRTPEALETLRARLNEFDALTQERGTEAYQHGAVVDVGTGADHFITAQVVDEITYKLTWFLTRGKWTERCPCAAGKQCAHAYAAGLAWLADVEAGKPDGRDPAAIKIEGKLNQIRGTISGAPRPGDPPPPTSPIALALDAEIGGWLRALPSADEVAQINQLNRLPDLGGLRLRLDTRGDWRIEIQGAANSTWRSPTKKWLTDLVALRPADFQGLPPAQAALANAIAAEYRLIPLGFPPKQPLPTEAVIGILRTAAARDALALPDGEPFVIEPTPLVPEATVSTDEPDKFDLRLVTPDGRLADAAILVAARPEPLYLFDNAVWRGPPPSPSSKLPIAALDDARLLPRLRAVGLRLPPGHAADVRTVRLRPHLKCWLSPAIDDEDRDFHAQLTARSDNPPCAQFYADDGYGWRWGRETLPPPRLAGEPVLEFDLGKAHIASERFGGFRLTWDGWAESWTRPVNGSFADEFLDWHESLAEELEVDVSPELATLLGAPLRVSVSTSLGAAGNAPGEQDWFDLSVGLTVNDTALSAAEIALLLKARGKWVHLPRHGWKRIDAAPVIDADTAAALDKLGLGVEDVMANGKPVKHQVHVLQLVLEAEALAERDSVMAHVLQTRAAQLIARPRAELPAALTATLRPYQLEGFQFLAHLSDLGFGGILADDMGLGKTVQTLAWLLHLAAQPRDAGRPPFKALIICPKSVVHGWLVETARFAPTLGISAFETSSRGTAVAETGPRLLVANYTQMRRHAALLRGASWDAVVLDEGQFIKNPGSQVAVAARSLRARRRVILTGTPIENKLSDLWSLFAFAQPGLLGDHAEFRRQYSEVDPAALARLHRRVHHFLLRRTKAQAAPDLPPRSEDEIVVELETAQRRLYDAELKRARAELLGIDTAKELGAVRFHVLASLLRLRQICCHPALVDPSHAALPSAKLEALLERIEELAEEGHQVLVFSQFVKMLEIIQTRLSAAGIGHLILTGATENRAELVETFQTDPSKTVFLLSLKAAGFGLNLTAASYAILYDPWWNPAAEAQAIDRIHRIGQTKPVIAYRLIAAGTVEEKIRMLQHEKSTLASAVVHEESLAQVMDLESLRDILA